MELGVHETPPLAATNGNSTVLGRCGILFPSIPPSPCLLVGSHGRSRAESLRAAGSQARSRATVSIVVPWVRTPDTQGLLESSHRLMTAKTISMVPMVSPAGELAPPLTISSEAQAPRRALEGWGLRDSAFCESLARGQASTEDTALASCLQRLTCEAGRARP